MWPDAPFAPPRGSFERPVVPPGVDPTVGPFTTVTFNCEWLPFVRGALQQLLLEASWKTGFEPLTLTQQRVFNLIDLFRECAPGAIPFACPGDLSLDSSPYGTWSLGFAGIYIIGQGYGPSYAQALPSPTFYYGLLVFITLPAPVFVDNIHVSYDMIKDLSDDPDDFSLDVQDVTNGGLMGTPITFGDMVEGNDQEYDTGSHTPALSEFLIALWTGRKNGGFVPTGNCRLRHVNLLGHATTPPC